MENGVGCEKKLFGKRMYVLGRRGQRQEKRVFKQNAWRGLAAIGVAVVLTMGECVSGIQLGIGKLGGSGMLTSYAEELWIPVSVTAETAQAAENAAELPVQAPEAILMEPPPELFCTKKMRTRREIQPA